MRISAKCDYGCRALLELSLHWPSKEPLSLHIISEKQKIPLKYLSQILFELKNIGLVNSVRGKEGGYLLARGPGRITLGEVMRNLGEPFLEMSDSAKDQESVFTIIWKETEEAIAKVLDKVNFEDIANKTKSMEGAVAYQI